MNTSLLWAGSVLSVALAATPAQASQALAQKHACLACHAVDKKLVGPSYQEIVKKYGNKPEMAVTLAKRIKAGGAGNWGPIPMPPQPALSEADALALAKWILGGAK